MKPEKHDPFDGRAQRSLADLRATEIVGQIENPVLEAICRLWWRTFDRLCGCFVSFRLWLFDRMHGPEPSTPADRQREADHERLIQALSAAGRAIEPGNDGPR